MDPKDPARPPLTLLRPLGAGGMGEVWLGHYGAEPAPVAIKRLHAGLARDPENVRLFEREARIGGLLHHENIVSLRAFGTDSSGPFLVLEYIEGPSAAGLVRAAGERQRQLPLPVVLSIARDVARALDCAHSLTTAAQDEAQGIIHRDLSPDNILLTRAGVAKLTDFGIAKAMGSTNLTRTGTVKGKIGFMAPELLEGASADARSDLFSLAATLFLVATGVRPFNGRTEAEQIHAVLHSEPPRLADLRPDLPPALGEWIERALSRDPAQRPGSARALVKQVEELLASELGIGPADARAEVARFLQESVPADPAPEPLGEGLSAPHITFPRAQRARVQRRRLVGWALGISGALVASGAVLALRGRATPVVAEQRASPPPAVAPEDLAVTPQQPPTAVTPPVAAVSHAPTHRTSTAPAGPTTLLVKVAPWGQVFVDGKLIGMTPLTPVAMSPGTHSLFVVNPELGVRKKLSVTLRAHEARVLRIDLKRR